MVLGIWIVAGIAAWLVWRVVASYPPASVPGQVLSPREFATIDAIGEVFYPPGHGVTPSGADAGVSAHIDGLLARSQPRQRIMIRLLFFLLEHATLLFPVWSAGLGALRRFSDLDLAAREAYLDGWASSHLFLRRLCFTSIRALCTFGYFGDAQVLRELGIAPRAIPRRIVEADLLYPPVGASRDVIRLTSEDLTPSGPVTPLGTQGPLAPGYEADLS